MRLIAPTHPIEVRHKKSNAIRNNEWYSRAEGQSTNANSPANEITEFQKFARERGSKITVPFGSFKMGDPLVADGVWGANTENAYGILGRAWELSSKKSYVDQVQKNEADRLAKAKAIEDAKAKASTSTSATTQTSPSDDKKVADDKKKDEAKKKTLKEKWDSLSKLNKGLIIGTSIAVLGTIVWVSTKSK